MQIMEDLWHTANFLFHVFGKLFLLLTIQFALSSRQKHFEIDYSARIEYIIEKS